MIRGKVRERYVPKKRSGGKAVMLLGWRHSSWWHRAGAWCHIGYTVIMTCAFRAIFGKPARAAWWEYRQLVWLRTIRITAGRICGAHYCVNKPLIKVFQASQACEDYTSPAA